MNFDIIDEGSKIISVSAYDEFCTELNPVIEKGKFFWIKSARVCVRSLYSHRANDVRLQVTKESRVTLYDGVVNMPSQGVTFMELNLVPSLPQGRLVNVKGIITNVRKNVR